MEPISFGLGLVGEVRQQVNSIKTRIANFQDGQNTFNSLSCKLDLLVQHMSVVDRLLNAVPNTVPAATHTDFNQILADVLESIKNENWTMPQSLSKPFTGSSSSAMGKIKLNVHQFTRAKALSAAMSSLEMKIEKASNKLLHFSSVLTSALNSKELQTKMDRHSAEAQEDRDAILSQLENIRIAGNVKELYTPVASSPAPSHSMILDFNCRDEKGNPETPEGLLRQSVLYGESPKIVTAATGALKPAYGVLGMAGVGKTVALQGLGHDEEVKKRFHDGVLYMTFGQGATLQTALREIAKIMTLTGATTSVEKVKNAVCLRDAVDYAVTWFEGKICLYLLDDLWPAENLPHGYFHDLRQLLRGSPYSRMAISTRSVAIASEAGLIVDFGPRKPLGRVSVNMFMSHAAAQSSPKSSSASIHDLRLSVSKILGICGGLPIALSVTGCAVSKLVRVYGTFDKACDVYAVMLEKKRALLGDKCAGYGTSLKAAILLSLEHLEVEFSEWATENSIEIDSSILDLYTGLCVLSNQAWMPVSVLSRLWKLEKDAAFDVANMFAGMSLATLTARRFSSEVPDEPGIVLHDLQLDFCQQKAKEKKIFPLWHAQLLNGYLQISSQTQNSDVMGRIIHFVPRPWWSEAVPDDGYIHANLCRHLGFAGCGIELAALLLNGLWTQLRSRIGGILALETDFELLNNVLGKELYNGDIRRGFELIFKAVRLSWGRMMKGPRVFLFHVCGRLAKLRKSSAVVDGYAKSIEKYTPKPYLLPVSSFFPDLESSLIMEIPVGGECSSVACSTCGRYFICGAGKNIVIVKTDNGEIMQRMEGHRSQITCIGIAGGANVIVSGSRDGTVMLWEWELSKYRVRVFERHSYNVKGVVITRDGGRICSSSSSDRTLRISHTTPISQALELPQSNGVLCVAFYEEDEMIAFGLTDGTLKVVNSLTKDKLFETSNSKGYPVLCASFSPKGLFLAAGSSDKTIRIWNTGTWTREGKSLNGHEGRVTCVSFSLCGKQIASSSDDGTIRVWDVETGECIGISAKIASGVTSVSFTMNGQRIVSGSRDGIVRIWDARLGKESREDTLRHAKLVWGAAISQDGLLVASASRDRTLRLWDANTGESVGAPLEGHMSSVLCVSISPNGRQLVSGSADHTLMLWDTGNHTQIGNLFIGHSDFVYAVSFSFDGRRILSGSADSTVRIWNAETHEQIGDVLRGHRKAKILCVSESSDGYHVVYRDHFEIAIIWKRNIQSIIWISEPRASGFQNKITDEEAETIIRSCGRNAPQLWPKSFPAYTAELYCVGDSIYSNLLGGETLLADTTLFTDALVEKRPNPHWSYHTGKRLFAAGLGSGAMAVCKMIIE